MLLGQPSFFYYNFIFNNYFKIEPHINCCRIFVISSARQLERDLLFPYAFINLFKNNIKKKTTQQLCVHSDNQTRFLECIKTARKARKNQLYYFGENMNLFQKQKIYIFNNYYLLFVLEERKIYKNVTAPIRAALPGRLVFMCRFELTKLELEEQFH